MNLVVMRITGQSLLGGRRGLLLMILPAVALGIAGLTRWASGGDPSVSANTANFFVLGTVVPILCLLIGTGVIGSEIEDGSVVYVLSKPIPRWKIAVSKLIVAYAAAFLFAVVPTALAALIGGDQDGLLASGMAVAATLAVLAYIPLFFWLGIVSRNAIVIGLLYALLWETTLGSWAPGIRLLSVRQWALAWAEKVLGGYGPRWGVESDVVATTAAILIGVTVIGAGYLAVRALQRLQLRAPE